MPPKSGAEAVNGVGADSDHRTTWLPGQCGGIMRSSAREAHKDGINNRYCIRT